MCARTAELTDPPTLTVVGTHQPRLLASTVPAVVRTGSSFAIQGRVVDSATGLGMASAKLSMGLGDDDFFYSLGNPRPGYCSDQVTTTSDSGGGFAFASQADPKSRPTSFAVCIDGPTQADGRPITILVSVFPIHRSTSQVARVPTGGVQTGDGSTAALPQVGLLPIGLVLLLAWGICAVFSRRLLRAGRQRR
jgi:hypothetical protein